MEILQLNQKAAGFMMNKLPFFKSVPPPPYAIILSLQIHYKWTHDNEISNIESERRVELQCSIRDPAF